MQADSGGDAYLVKELPGKVLVAVVDGLGHGRLARRASARTIELLQANDYLNLELLLEITHKALSDTVGVVLGLALVDYQQGLLTCSGVGNVTIRILGEKEKSVRLPEGILGYRTLKTMCREIALSEKDVLVMHTDGIRDDYEVNPSLLSCPRKIAEALAAGYRRPTDDALILVATELLSKGLWEEASL